MCSQDKRTVQLDEVKQQCVHIIGMLGGSINHALVSRTDPAHLEKLAVAWDSHKHLRFDVPFQDVKPTIYFGQSLQSSIYFTESSMVSCSLLPCRHVLVAVELHVVKLASVMLREV